MLTAAARVDTLGYFDRLMTAGFPEAQARVQAELFREQADFQGRELQQTIEKYDEARRKEIATRGDVQDVRLEIEKVRAETEKIRAELKTDIEKVRSELKTDIEKVRAEVEKVRAETEKIRAELKTDIEKLRGEVKSDIEKVRYDLLKWQIGLAVGIVAIMAKGFGWIGF